MSQGQYKAEILWKAFWTDSTCQCAIWKLEHYYSDTVQANLKDKSNKRKSSEMHEGIEGNHAGCLYSTLSSCTLWAGAWHLNPTSIGVFQEIKMRQPKLFNANFAGKIMELQWYCPGKANWQRLVFQLSMNEDTWKETGKIFETVTIWTTRHFYCMYNTLQYVGSSPSSRAPAGRHRTWAEIQIMALSAQ